MQNKGQRVGDESSNPRIIGKSPVRIVILGVPSTPVKGDTLQRWRTDPFIMISGRARWIPPSVPIAKSPEHLVSGSTYAAGRSRIVKKLVDIVIFIHQDILEGWKHLEIKDFSIDEVWEGY